MDGLDGLTQVLKLDDDTALGQDAVFLNLDAEAGRLEGLVEMILELFAGAAPRDTDQGYGGLAKAFLEFYVAEVFVVQTVESAFWSQHCLLVLLAREFEEH